eukprot:4981065-Pyramimonas_sp.AAC.1
MARARIRRGHHPEAKKTKPNKEFTQTPLAQRKTRRKGKQGDQSRKGSEDKTRGSLDSSGL